MIPFAGNKRYSKSCF